MYKKNILQISIINTFFPLRTFSLLEKVCTGVGPRQFYGKLWECISTNSGVRLAAITYVLSHFDKRLSMEDQLHIMGTNVDIMVRLA